MGTLKAGKVVMVDGWMNGHIIMIPRQFKPIINILFISQFYERKC